LVAAFDMAPARPRIMQHCLWRRRLFDPSPWTNNGVLPPHGPAGAAIPRLSGGPCGPITLPPKRETSIPPGAAWYAVRWSRPPL